MPTYEYRCPEGHEFDAFQRMSDPPVAECPECGEEAERVLSAGAGLIFKGSGFYITDYRDDGYKKAAEAEKKGADTKSGDGGSGNGESDGSKASGSNGADASSGTKSGTKGGSKPAAGD